MLTRSIAQAAALGATLVWLTAASAQSPAVNPGEMDSAKQQQAQQLRQPYNNAPVWSEVRSGAPQVSTVTGRESTVLIQSSGETWRAARVPIATAGGFLFIFALLVLLAFYLWRGPIVVHGKPTGRLIERFTVVQRFVHWTVAITFTALAVTGLIITFGKSILLPLIGYTLFSWLAIVAKNLHNFVGPILVLALPVMIAMFVRTNAIHGSDLLWFQKFGGMVSGEHVAADKANAGQKVLFWILAVLFGLTLCVTGLILDFPNFDQTRQAMQWANGLHMIAALFAVCLLAGHIYLGTIGMQGAWEAMRYGYVDETWAKEHHEYWYNDVIAGKAPRGHAPSAPLPVNRPA